jgi:ribonuclease HI
MSSSESLLVGKVLAAVREYLAEAPPAVDPRPKREKPELEAGNPDRYEVYTDGSYEFGACGWGWYAPAWRGQPEQLHFGGAPNDGSRNITGEVYAALHATKWCMEAGIADITIVHDYEGIEGWGRAILPWKANKQCSKLYREWMRYFRSGGMTIRFRHVKGHSGCAGNHRADSLAGRGRGQPSEFFGHPPQWVVSC